MPLRAMPGTVPAEDFFHIFYHGVNTDTEVITLLFRAGTYQPDGTVKLTRSNVTVNVSRTEWPALYVTLLSKYRPLLQSDLYKLLQDVGAIPAGVVS